MPFHDSDPYSGQRLNEIMPLSARARSWLARVTPCIPEGESIPAVGAVAILAGLDYHHVQFMRLFARLEPYYSRFMAAENFSSPALPTPQQSQALDALDHEAVAYFNRMGQFFAYAKARGFQLRLPNAGRLMVFRNKHTAHRSIDAPRGETQSEREQQAMIFGFYRLTRGGFPTYQILSGKRDVEFQMRRDHPILMQEAIDALFSLYPPPNDA